MPVIGGITIPIIHIIEIAQWVEQQLEELRVTGSNPVLDVTNWCGDSYTPLHIARHAIGGWRAYGYRY